MAAVTPWAVTIEVLRGLDWMPKVGAAQAPTSRVLSGPPDRGPAEGDPGAKDIGGSLNS